MKGIYVIHLPEMELNIYKVGCSKDIKSRIESFNNDTLRLYPVEVVYIKEFEDYKKAEKEIHKKLKKYRVSSKREFFKCDLYYILNVINNVYMDFKNNSYYLSSPDTALEYYYNYLGFKNMKLIIEQRPILSAIEIYNYVKDFIKTYEIAENKIYTLPDGNEKEMYKDLIQDMNTIIRSEKIENLINSITL